MIIVFVLVIFVVKLASFFLENIDCDFDRHYLENKIRNIFEV